MRDGSLKRRLVRAGAVFLVIFPCLFDRLSAAPPDAERIEIVPQLSASFPARVDLLGSPHIDISGDGRVLVTRALSAQAAITLWNAENGHRLREIEIPQGYYGLWAMMSHAGTRFALKPYGLLYDTRTGRRAWNRWDYIAEISADGRYLLTLDRRAFDEKEPPTPALRAGQIVDLQTGAATPLPPDTDLSEAAAWALPTNKFLLRSPRDVWRVIDPTGASPTLVTTRAKPYPAPPADLIDRLFNNDSAELVRLQRTGNELIYVREQPSGVEVYARKLGIELGEKEVPLFSPNGRYLFRRDPDHRGRVRIWDLADAAKPQLIAERSYPDEAEVLAFHPTRPWAFVVFTSSKYANGYKVSALQLPDLEPVYDLGEASLSEVKLRLGGSGLEVAAERVTEPAGANGEVVGEATRGTIFGLREIVASVGRSPVLFGPDQPLTELKSPSLVGAPLSFAASANALTQQVRTLLGLMKPEQADLVGYDARRRALLEERLRVAFDALEKAHADGKADKVKELETELESLQRERTVLSAGTFGSRAEIAPLDFGQQSSGSSPTLSVRTVEQANAGAEADATAEERRTAYQFRRQMATASGGRPASVRTYPFKIGQQLFEVERLAVSPGRPPMLRLQDERVRTPAGEYNDGLLAVLKDGAEVVTRHQSGQIALWSRKSGQLLRIMGTECTTGNVQEALRARGFYNGAANGRPGAATKAALDRHFADIGARRDELLLSEEDAAKPDVQARLGLKSSQFKDETDLIHFACQTLGFFGHYTAPEYAVLVEGSDTLVTAGEDGIQVADLGSGRILGRSGFGPGVHSGARVAFATLPPSGTGEPKIVVLKPGVQNVPLLHWPDDAPGQKAVLILNVGTSNAAVFSGGLAEDGEVRWLRWPDLAPLPRRELARSEQAAWNTNFKTLDAPGYQFELGKTVSLAGERALTVDSGTGSFIGARAAADEGGTRIAPFPVFTDARVLAPGRAVAVVDGGRTLLTTHVLGQLALWDAASGAYLRSLGTPCTDENLRAALLQAGVIKSAASDTALAQAMADLFEQRQLKLAPGRKVRRPDATDDYQDVPLRAQDFSSAAHRRYLACAMLGLFGHGQSIRLAAVLKESADDRAPPLLTVSEKTIMVSDAASGRTTGLLRFGGTIESVSAALLMPDDQSLLWQEPVGVTGGVVEVVWPKVPPGAKGPRRVLIVRTERGSVYRLGLPDLAPEMAYETGAQAMTVSTFAPQRKLQLFFIGTASGEWIALTPAGFFAASPGGVDLIKIVRGLESFSATQFYTLNRPDLLEESWKGDPEGKYKDESFKLNLQNILDSGPAPQLEFIEKRTERAGDTVRLAVRITDTSGGIGSRLEWRVNGKIQGEIKPPALQGLTAPSLGTAKTVVETLRLDATQANVVEVVAYNGEELISTPPLRINVDAAGATTEERSRLHVLGIGVDKYRMKPFELRYAVKDAQTFVQAVAAVGKGLLAPGETITLLDEQVTEANMLEAFERIGRAAKPADVFVLFLGGHGKSIAGQYYYYPQSLDFAAGQTVERNGIGLDKWQAMLAKVGHIQKALLILDTCESGAATGLVRGAENARQAAMIQLEHATGQNLIAAARASDPAYEGFHGHGVLTFALLEALSKTESRSDDDRVKVGQLADYVDERVPAITQQLFGVYQKPVRKLSGNDFPIGLRQAGLADSPIEIPLTPTHVILRLERVREHAQADAQGERQIEAGTQVRVVEFAGRDGQWAVIARAGQKLGYVPVDALLKLQ